MTIQTTDTDKLLVTGWTNTVHFQNVTREGTLKELGDLKDSFLALSKSFTELTDIIKLNRLTVEFHMAYDDAGKVGIGLCSEIDGKVNWYIS